MVVRGSRWMVVLAMAGLALVVLLSWQAVVSARQHRQMAEAVLRDYAELAADELVRRSASQVGYYGFYPRATTLVASFEEPDASLATASTALEAAGHDDLVERIFHARPAGEVALSQPDSALASWIAEQLATLPPSTDRPYGVLHGVVSGQQRMVVYGRLDDGFAGFEVDRGALEGPLRAALEQGPLLPASLGPSETEHQPLKVRVLDPQGLVLMTSGPTASTNDPYTPRLTAEVPFGDSYQGVLDGYTVSVTLDPQTADSLVIGGLPASRLPLLVGLALLTVGLVTAALLAARKVQQVAQLRTDFIARVSHELRTPLTQIRMFAETLLLDRAPDPTSRRRALTIIDREARRLSHLVDNILHFSRNERRHPDGAESTSRRSQALRPLLAQIVDRLRPLVVGQSLRVEDRLDDATQARIDGDALHQVLLNLVDNALKYGPPEQEVQLRWELVGEVVRLQIEDEGPGVPETQREQIWRDFERLDRPLESAVAGTGIGLSVVRELVEQQDGRVWVEDGAGGGARFVVELPIDRSDGARP